MKQGPAGVGIKPVFMAASLCIAAVFTSALFAQSGSRPSRIERRIDEINRQREKYERDTLRGDRKESSDKSEDKKRARAINAQVIQDFESLQTVYNRLVMAMQAKEEIGYGFISESAEDIRKCAARLKTNLVLPQPADDKKGENKEADLDEKEIKTSLLIMCNHITSFVTNPLFESSGVLDIELSSKASLDLREIIELSERIRRSADKLKKSGAP